MPHLYIIVIPLDLSNPCRVPPSYMCKYSPEKRGRVLSFVLESKSRLSILPSGPGYH